MKKITLLTSGHPPFDERIFNKFAVSLKEAGYQVSIFCSTLEIKTIKEDILIQGFNGLSLSKKDKLDIFLNLLKNFNPDIVICCEQLPVFSAYKYKKRYNKKLSIILDVTEWYPENILIKKSLLKRMIFYPLYLVNNVITSNLADKIIVGEITKLKRYKVIAPVKPKKIISYYPILKYFNYSKMDEIKDELILCYSGLLKFDRGIKTIVEAANIVKSKTNIKVKIKFLGKFENEAEENGFYEFAEKFPDLNIEMKGWNNYESFSDNMNDVHICLDLREDSFVYRNSLPIKIFEYMALGKPYIFSNVKPIRLEMASDDFGFLVDPTNIKEIADKILYYLHNPETLKHHSENARKEIEKEKNWENEKVKLYSFL